MWTVGIMLLLARGVGACTTDADCGCDGSTLCSAGACAQAFTLPAFPIASPPTSAYTAPMIAVLDHAGGFYTGCCDTTIVAFTGERALRDASAVLCPAAPTFPACLFASCLCGYAAADGASFAVNGSYVGVVGATHLQYDGHAGYDYEAAAGTPLQATRGGLLCKAIADPVNGTAGQATAWEAFHTFYVDHGVVAGAAWSSWYLHAADLVGGALTTLAPGQCAPVVTGQVIATVGNVGTLVPHLHFETRRGPPGSAAEDATAKVVDPYGWRGTQPDPWSLPGANPQAETQGAALWRGCGNGRVECGEDCDDGNVHNGDCCSATCAFEADGGTCGTSPNPCARERCDGGGHCRDLSAARPTCRAPVASHAASFQVRDGGGTSGDRLQWKWRKGAATAAGEFGNPLADQRYRVCAFAESTSPPLIFGAAVPAAATCPACWKGLGSPPGSRGFRYRDRTGVSDGVVAATLQAGGDGKAAITITARGSGLVLPPLPLALPVRVQLWAEDGACWEARYDTAGVQQHDGTRFKARSD